MSLDSVERRATHPHRACDRGPDDSSEGSFLPEPAGQLDSSGRAAQLSPSLVARSALKGMG